MILALDTDLLPDTLRDVFESLQAQIAKQWQQAHTPQGKPLHKLLAAYHNAQQTVANNSWVALTFNSEEDLRAVPGVTAPSISHSKTTRSDRFVVIAPTGGLLKAHLFATIESNATGIRGARILLNGAAQRGSTVLSSNASAASKAFLHVPWTWPVVQGDEITCEVFQNSGGSLITSESIAEAQNRLTLELE